MVIPEAARRLCRETPLVFASSLGCWLKLESLQSTGSFKLRGAALKLSRVRPGTRAVVAASAGNHGLGLALAARAMGMHATVVVPRSSVAVKRDGIVRLGAEVIVDGDSYDQAEAVARRLSEARELPFVSAFDDEDIIDGNGRWLGRELFAERPHLARVIAPVGGGGLISGLGLELGPHGVELVGVQPRANCAMHHSLAVGQAQLRYHGEPTVCEGLEGAVAERTYQLVRAHVRQIVLVDESDVLAAVAFAYRALGLLVEPSAAVVIAAARAGRVLCDERTALVITGSNLDGELLDRALAAN
jgi:threonine dehydratase